MSHKLTRIDGGKSEKQEPAGDDPKVGGDEPARRRVPGETLRPLLVEQSGQKPAFALDRLMTPAVDAWWRPPPLQPEALGQEFVTLRGFLLQSGYWIEGYRIEESLAYTLGGKVRELVFTVRPCRNPFEAALVWTELHLYRGYFALLQQAEQKAADAPRIILPP